MVQMMEKVVVAASWPRHSLLPQSHPQLWQVLVPCPLVPPVGQLHLRWMLGMAALWDAGCHFCKQH